MTEPINEAERIDRLEQALVELKQITGFLPSDEQAERAIRTEDKLNRLLGLAALPLIAIVGLMVMLMVAVYETKASAKANRAGVLCILTELAEHRAANHAFNRAIAEKVGVPVENHRTLLPGSPSDEEIEERCGQFHEHHVVAER